MLTKKNVTLMWYSNDMFHYMPRAEFVTLVSLKIPSGSSASQLFLRPILTRTSEAELSYSEAPD